MVFRLIGRTARSIALAAKRAANIGLDYGLAGEAAQMGYELAIEMCGNAGQVSVIEQTDYLAFYDGARAVLQGDSSSGYLYAACPYPEAVGEILDEVSMEIDSFIETALGGSYGTGAEVVDEYW